VEYDYTQISTQVKKDSSIIVLTQPYRDSVTKTMNEIIGYAENDMQLKQPNSSIGNYFADAILHSAQKKFNKKVDAAIVNIGGIRLTQLKKGQVTKSHIYELMPFENMVVLLSIKGDVLQQFLNHIASTGGWPIAGIKMQIKNKQAINVFINDQPISKDKFYTLATSDYVANGGENAIMLKTIPKDDKGYLIRDAVFDYIKNSGNKIQASEEKRITNVE
jgi:2',3'-cyclic-nucleotide 2'-phosphodiesterase (5'-nucleotidase family)